MMFGQTIPKGYYIVVQTSENDGDNSKTFKQSGLTKDFVDVIQALFPLFKSARTLEERKILFGNKFDESDIDKWDFLESVQKRLNHLDKNVVDNILKCDIMVSDLERTSEQDEENMFDLIACFVQTYITDVGDFFFRYVETLDVYFLEDDVIIPNVEKVNSLS